jgi:hypothetical protein
VPPLMLREKTVDCVDSDLPGAGSFGVFIHNAGNRRVCKNRIETERASGHCPSRVFRFQHLHEIPVKVTCGWGAGVALIRSVATEL